MTLALKALGFQPFESTSLSNLWFQIVNLHPYISEAEAKREPGWQFQRPPAQVTGIFTLYLEVGMMRNHRFL